MQSLREDIKPYIDIHGFVRSARGTGSTDNGPLWTSMFYLMVPDIQGTDSYNFSKLIDQTQVPNYPGLYSKAPGIFKNNSVDNLIAVAAASKRLDTPHRFEILNHGRKHNYVWNNIDPLKFSFSAWLGRMPGFIAHLQFCCGETPSLFNRIAQFVGILITTFDKAGETSNRILADIQIQCMDDHEISKMTRWLFNADLKKRYGSVSMKGVFNIFFEKGHPFTKYAH